MDFSILPDSFCYKEFFLFWIGCGVNHWMYINIRFSVLINLLRCKITKLCYNFVVEIALSISEMRCEFFTFFIISQSQCVCVNTWINHMIQLLIFASTCYNEGLVCFVNLRYCIIISVQYLEICRLFFSCGHMSVMFSLFGCSVCIYSVVIG